MIDRQSPLFVAAFTGLLLLCIVEGPSFAGGPSLQPAHQGAVVVSGKGAVGSGPIAIYDVTFEAPTKLGAASSMDHAGNFAVSVDPPLRLGHRIVAVDRTGARSPPVAVQANVGPAGEKK